MRKKRKNNPLYIFVLLIGFVQLYSCSGVKHLAEGERYYAGAEIKFRTDQSIEKKEKLKMGLDDLIATTPNSKILGSRPSVFFYHMIEGEPDENQKFKRFIKYKLGSEPVLQEDVEPDRTASRMENYMKNHGFFNAQVGFDVEEKEHEAIIIYNVLPHNAYHVRNIFYPKVDSVYQDVLDHIQEETLLDSGMRYNLEVLKAEQKRIENLVENEGFFYFNADYLIYKADSSVGDHQVDLTLLLQENTPERAKKKFTVDSIFIYPDYSVVRDTIPRKKKQTFVFNNHVFIDDSEYMRKDVLVDAIVLEPDSTYSQLAQAYSLEHLLNLGTYKYVNIKFDQIDSSKLSSSIYMTPFPKKSIRFKVEGITKNNGFAGPAIGITFSNRNTFRGGELLELSVNGAYNWQFGGTPGQATAAYEFGVESKLTFPRIISPFDIIDYMNWRYLPNTQMKLGAKVQERVGLFRLNSINAGYGFLWRTSITKSHELFPINISYVQLASQSEEFSNRRENDPTLFRSIQDQYIVGGTYSYTFNSKAREDSDDELNHFYFNPSVDLSGNLVKAVQAISQGEAVAARSDYELFNRTYSQYAKGQVDFRYYRTLSRNSDLATRFLVGVARPYGNSQDVPFIKQFFAGGTNDIRAFQARSLGPGSYDVFNDASLPSDGNLFFDVTGDIKLLANVEYRTEFTSIVHGAVFLDAGNVWLWDEDRPGGEFRWNRFYQQIALGGGVGVRFDFNFFILRFDVATPLYNPRKDLGNRWLFNSEPRELEAEQSWISRNLLLNIGIGYPF